MPKAYEMSCSEISTKVRSGELTAEEIVLVTMERIAEVEGRVHAFISILGEDSLARAREIDRKVRAGEKLGRLAGVPVAVKDNICMRGVLTTCGSNILRNYVPPYNATVVERLLYEDAIIVGKTNMDEFAMGTTTESSCFGPTRNPWHLDKVPGGSSGGSAAAVSALEVASALGSDTGGSVRCPASFCSVVGLKPTYGSVSRYGLVAYANSLEQIGPVTRSVSDSALLLSVISGHDPKDSTSVDQQLDDSGGEDCDIEDANVGVVSEFLGEGTDASVAGIVWDAAEKLEEKGASLVTVSLPSLRYALSAYYLIAMSEASSNLAQYDGIRYGHRTDEDSEEWKSGFSRTRREGFGAEVKRRIILGTYALSAGYFQEYYVRALRVRGMIGEELSRAFRMCDIMLGPTMPVLPFDIGTKIEDPLSLYMCDIDTVPANLAGIPAISVPAGFSGGLPIGIQLMAQPFGERMLFAVAGAFERNCWISPGNPPL